MYEIYTATDAAMPFRLWLTIPERFRHWRLENMQDVNPIAERYCSDLKAIRDGKGLIIVGPTGTGKTTLAVAVLHRIAETSVQNHIGTTWENFARFITAHDLYDIARDFESPAHMEHRNIRLLVIDDIGATSMTEYARTELAALLDHRYASFRPTITTSNLPMQTFAEYVGERTLSRFRESCDIIELKGSDRRRSKPKTQEATHETP